VNRRYLVISPVRNEAKYLERTIASMVAQTVRPARWVLVDDGSSDATPEIIERAAAEHPWITLYRRPDRGKRQVGAGVVEAFYDGLAQVNLDDYDYLCKLDGDLEFSPTYFQRMIERCEAEPRLGTVSGKLWLLLPDGRTVSERIGDDMSIGPAKFYRTACFKDIGGFVRFPSWDGIDCHFCRMRGWLAGSIEDPELRVIHLRMMGSSQQGVWTGRKRWGLGKYYMGSHPLFMLAVVCYRMAERPWIIGGLGIGYGYLRAWLRRQERFEHPEYRAFLRRYEFRCLTRGKRRALAELHDAIRRGESVVPPGAARPVLQGDVAR
jgi:glycosyltransferase involved in cell wall biosynthesis